MRTLGDITLGDTVSPSPKHVRITSDDSELKPHLEKPWVTELVEKELGIPIRPPKQTGSVRIDPASLRMHVLLVGKSGHGKTKLAAHLAIEQLRRGASLVFIDAKESSLRRVLGAVEATKLVPPENVTLMLPSDQRPPAWNPLDLKAQGMDAAQAAGAFLAVVKNIRNDDKPSRWPDILYNALILAAVHGLTLFEVLQMLRSPAYVKALLRLPLPSPDLVHQGTFREVLEFFKTEYPAFTKGGNLGDMQPAITRIREVIRNPYLAGMMCSRRPSFRPDSLWEEQKVLLVHLDSILGDEAASILGGMLVPCLMAAAKRNGGPDSRDVVLCVDEIAFTQDFLGKNPKSVISMGREFGVNWIAGCQYLDDINTDLRKALLSVSTRAFFALHEDDTRRVAEMAAGRGKSLPAEAHLSVANRKAGAEDYARFAYPVVDINGQAFGFDIPEYFRGVLGLERPLQIKGLQLQMHDAGLDPLACIPFGGKRLPLDEVLRGVPDSDWRLAGPDPVLLLVQFPRPKVAAVKGDTSADLVREWEDRLLKLKKQHVVLYSPSTPGFPELVVTDTPDVNPSEGYLKDVLKNGQDEAEVLETGEWRKEQADLLAAPPPEPEPVAKPAPAAPPKPSPKPAAKPAMEPLPPGEDDDTL